MKICGISFKANGKIYNFHPNGLEIKKGDSVIVETEKGEQYGKVSFVEKAEVNSNLKNILRIATAEDYNKYLKNLADAQKALLEARRMAKKLDLEMQIIDGSYTFDRKQLLFNFIADSRVDFRELVRELASRYRTRIELHQIGVRDKAKEVGGLGVCGRTLCCSKHLNNHETITINMAKNQGIALNPNKINGCCGRLLCCLSYEDETYSKCRRELPSYGDIIKVDGARGKVVGLDILKNTYRIDINGEIKEVKVEKSCCHNQ